MGTIEQMLIDSGIEAGLAARLADQARPSIRIATDDRGTAAPRSSRLGGRPDVPAGFEWPMWKDRPQSFIAQIRLEEVAGFECAAPLPDAGLLSFFYDSEQETWGFDPEDAGSFRVYYFDEASALAPADWPAGLGEGARYAPSALRFAEEQTPLPFDSYSMEALDLEEEASDAYVEFLESWEEEDEEAYQHRLLGNPDVIQGDMQVQCACVAGGIYCGGPEMLEHPDFARLEKNAPDWRLLLQIDSDEEAGMMWGDLGRLYYWITERDLRDRRFEKSWLVVQCS